MPYLHCLKRFKLVVFPTYLKNMFVKFSPEIKAKKNECHHLGIGCSAFCFLVAG